VKSLGISSLRAFKYALSILGAHQYLFENGNPTGGFEFSALSIPLLYFH